MNRRTFNKTLIATTAGALTGWNAHAESKTSVTVVGAGLAGLICAYELTKLGLQVTIVEASPRLGGRVDTLRLADGQYTEAGGYAFNRTDFASSYVDELGLEKEGLGFQPGLKTIYRFNDRQWTAASIDQADWPLKLSREEHGLPDQWTAASTDWGNHVLRRLM